MHPISLTYPCACARTHTHTHRHTHAHTGQICARGLPHLRRNQGRVPRPSPCRCHVPRPSPCRYHVRAYVCLSVSVCVCFRLCVLVTRLKPSVRLSVCLPVSFFGVCVCVCVYVSAACPRLPSLSQSPCHLAIAPQRPIAPAQQRAPLPTHYVAPYCTLLRLVAPYCGLLRLDAPYCGR